MTGRSASCLVRQGLFFFQILSNFNSDRALNCCTGGCSALFLLFSFGRLCHEQKPCRPSRPAFLLLIHHACHSHNIVFTSHHLTKLRLYHLSIQPHFVINLLPNRLTSTHLNTPCR